jgi:ABC-type nitrate/sulfonate/bicarbonate transport system ATPase subunit
MTTARAAPTDGLSTGTLNPLAHQSGQPQVVSVREASKSFSVPGGRIRVLDNLSLTVRAGEIVSIVGPSGCGKTTLLRMIQGLEPASEGTVEIEGRPVGAGQVDAGFVFQQPALFPWFTVRHNVAYGLRLRAAAGKFSKAEQDNRVHELIELVGLAGFETYRPHQLSGGMRQRVNLARALAIDPAVLLLDEPFSAVDMLTRERLQRVLSSLLSSLNTTAILVTHDIREAVFLGSRVVVMASSPGRIVAEHEIGEPHPRSEDFQHDTRLAEVAQSVYADLHRVESQALRAPDDVSLSGLLRRPESREPRVSAYQPRGE